MAFHSSSLAYEATLLVWVEEHLAFRDIAEVVGKTGFEVVHEVTEGAVVHFELHSVTRFAAGKKM